MHCCADLKPGQFRWRYSKTYLRLSSRPTSLRIRTGLILRILAVEFCQTMEVLLPRYTAPGYPSCYIDCPAGGYALYLAPLGPCRTKCDPSTLQDELLAYIRQKDWSVRSSATVRRITRGQLGDLSRHLRQAPPGGGQADKVLDDLEQIGKVRQHEEIDAAWDNLDVVEALERLRDAASNSSPDGGAMVAPG